MAATDRSLHQILGGGSVADVLLWRSRSASASVLAAATAFWVLFVFAGYSPVALAANSLLLLVAVVFFWARAAALLHRPLPPIPNLEISDEAVERLAGRAMVWVNSVLSVARDIAIERDRKVFLQVVLSLWVVSYIGSFFSFLTVVYIGVVLLLTVPALYDKYQDHVNEKLGIVHTAVSRHYDRIVSRTSELAVKGKKTQ
ncbi:putative reticulon-like protein B11 [Iris pallida]|uniref:Reticulon-like protein n=1 Tax=Iris pallida TaxID=29817 RepID=A0AAX6GN39_IRIPA|nr:putative reticulon-like protein B11 [Iris pallida]